MADVLFVTMDGGGNVPPMLGVAGALAARGHRVRIIGHERLRAEVERTGLPFHAYDRAREWDSTARTERAHVGAHVQRRTHRR